RRFRVSTLALQGSSLAEAILSAVNAVDGVTSSFLRENYTNSYQVIDGVGLVAHSIFVVVEGGHDMDVAEAILSKKSGGCNMNNPAEASNPVEVEVIEP